MQYLFLICLDDSFRPTPTLGADTQKWVDEMDNGKFRMMGDRLVPLEEAVTVRIRNGKTQLTSGPFAVTETKIVGFDVINCRNKEEAVQIALKHPMAELGTIEIRQFWKE